MQYKVSDLRLPGYAQELVTNVIKSSGYPVCLAEEDAIGYDFEVRMAGLRQPYHRLACVPAYRDYRLHFLVSAAVKIRRVWDLCPEERLFPVSDACGRLPEQDRLELQRKLPPMPPDDFDKFGRFLYQGLTRQLTSMPMDIRVEREIAEEIPQHREAQRAYLSRQVQDLEPTFNPMLARTCPDRLYAASTAMNVVLAEEAADLVDVQAGSGAQQTPHRVLGERLRERLHSIEEPGYVGDRRLTDLWAEELGVRNFYSWVRLDEVR